MHERGVPEPDAYDLFPRVACRNVLVVAYSAAPQNLCQKFCHPLMSPLRLWGCSLGSLIPPVLLMRAFSLFRPFACAVISGVDACRSLHQRVHEPNHHFCDLVSRKRPQLRQRISNRVSIKDRCSSWFIDRDVRVTNSAASSTAVASLNTRIFCARRRLPLQTLRVFPQYPRCGPSAMFVSCSVFSP